MMTNLHSDGIARAVNDDLLEVHIEEFGDRES